jgi:hypothetical protein
MRKIVVVFAGCLVLTGCGSESWKQDVRFKVDKIYEVPTGYDRKDAQLRLELVGEVPDDILEPDTLSPKVVKRREIQGEVRVGDEVTCQAEQDTEGYFQTSVIDTRLWSCEKA